MVRFRLDNKRMPLAAGARPKKLEKAQIARCVDPDGEATIKEARATENLQLLEVVDVIDIATGAPTYQLYQWPHGSGILFEHGTTRVIGDFVQHAFDQQPPDLELRAALAAAYDDAIPRLGLTREVDFLPGTPPRAAQPARSQLGDAIAAMRTAVAGGAKPTDDELWKLVGPAFGASLRPVPALRLADLTPTQRAGLELIADLGKPCAYGRLGLPLGRHFFYGDPQVLARYLGRVPAGPLEEAIEIDGAGHPAWCLVHDVLYEVRPLEPVLACLRALPPERASPLWTALARTKEYALREPLPRTKQEDRESAMAQAPQRFRAHLRRFLDLLVGFDEGNQGGDAPVELARDAQARLDDPFSALAALACLHRRGRLDSSWDGLCTAVMGATAREAYQPLVAELLGRS